MTEKNLSEISTSELVEELSKREGVDIMNVPVEGQHEIYIEKYSDKPLRMSHKENCIYDEIHGGPAIILR